MMPPPGGRLQHLQAMKISSWFSLVLGYDVDVMLWVGLLSAVPLMLTCLADPALSG
jgi:hypothetical protein